MHGDDDTTILEIARTECADPAAPALKALAARTAATLLELNWDLSAAKDALEPHCEAGFESACRELQRLKQRPQISLPTAAPACVQARPADHTITVTAEGVWLDSAPTDPKQLEGRLRGAVDLAIAGNVSLERVRPILRALALEEDEACIMARDEHGAAHCARLRLVKRSKPGTKTSRAFAVGPTLKGAELQAGDKTFALADPSWGQKDLETLDIYGPLQITDETTWGQLVAAHARLCERPIHTGHLFALTSVFGAGAQGTQGSALKLKDGAGADLLLGGHALDAQLAAPARKGLAPKQVKRVMRQNMTRFRACYERQLVVQPDLAGKITLTFTISSKGTVEKAGIENDTVGEPVADCLVHVIEKMRFPKSAKRTDITYPFIFRAAR